MKISHLCVFFPENALELSRAAVFSLNHCLGGKFHDSRDASTNVEVNFVDLKN